MPMRIPPHLDEKSWKLLEERLDRGQTKEQAARLKEAIKNKNEIKRTEY